jgi:hypothetical protein
MRGDRAGAAVITVNLALADPGLVWELSRQLGFSPELAYLPTVMGIEIHALLHQEIRQVDSLAEIDEFDPRIDRLIEAGIDSEGIRFVYGRGQANVAWR